MLFTGDISKFSFSNWIRIDSENKFLLKLSFVAVFIQFSVFKWFYPFPNFMPPDTNSYVEAAINNATINMWPIGYSKFLRLISCFTNSHLVLVFFQYLLLQFSLLYFLFSIRYLLSTPKWPFRILLTTCLLNPLIPHIGNFVSSDALFAALSLIWLTQLLWISYFPSRRLLLCHAFVLLIVFEVRFSALYYPLLTIISIILARLTKISKLLAITTIIFLLGSFVFTTGNKYREKTGFYQFSAFGGWQMASNALYGYAYDKPTDPSLLPKQFRDLHKLVNYHMDSIHRLAVRPDRDVSIYYLWDFKSPLKLYLNEQIRIKKDTSTPFFYQWAALAPLYASYGRYLISHHPKNFTRHYLWPNLVKYYAPPTGFMGYYNLGNTEVDTVLTYWFGWKNGKVYNRFKTGNIEIASAFSIIFPIINLLFVSSFLFYLFLGGIKKSSTHCKKIIIWVIVVWIVNMVFSVLAAPIELRYQIFPIFITYSFLYLLITFIINQSMTISNKAFINPSNSQL